ncbi:MAG TPA: WXG100 family type VII secretion target [Trebonia sp.]|jgi:WXG100 family type VII secretion target|nr:WXG100 family type VII secretion target [Trebonia sp.]
MATGESAVNRQAMATAAQQVETAVTTIRGLQTNMNGYTAQLQAGWQGDAATAFANTYEAFNADFTKVLTALQTIHDKLVGTHGTYTTTEDVNTSSVNRVAGLLGG